MRLPTQNPLLFTLHKGEILYRHHQSVHDPIFFGTTGNYRFDDPDCPAPGAFGVLYAGADPSVVVFWESCGSTTGIPAVSGAFLDARQIARMELTEELRLSTSFEPGGLTSISADGRLVTGSYKVAQQWSAALKKHPAKPDRIRLDRGMPQNGLPTRFTLALQPHSRSLQ